MSNARNIASGAKFVDTAGDTMTGALTVGGTVTVNPDADSSLLIKDGGTNALMMTAAAGDELYIGANNEYAFRIKNDGTKDVAFDNGGRVTMPSQPAFKAYLSSTHANVTGNGAVHSNGYLWTSVFNIGSHFNDSGTFTAPVAGRYLFAGHWALLGTAMGDATYHTFPVNGSTPGYSSSGLSMFDPRSMEWDQNRVNSGGTTILSLSANDTVTMYGGNLDSGSANVDLVGGNVWHTTIFSGYLIG